MNLKCTMLGSVIALAACGSGGDKVKDDDTAKAQAKIRASALSPEDYRIKQKAFADSVLNTVTPTKAIVERLGKGYEIGSTRLRDTVAMLAADKKSDCFGVGRKTDPYLAGTVTFWINMNLIGSDVVRVQEFKWTSPAGNAVVACLNQAAKDWKFDPTFGKPKAYMVQVQFK
jgi:hypothetical protein